MKIVILTGGTGSIALQTGLYELLDKDLDGLQTTVLVNAYDNGLSTGAVRRVCGGHILGPSDVRKNQTTRLKLEKPNSPWIKFLDTRFTAETSTAEQFCLSKIDDLERSLQSYADITDPVSLIKKASNASLLKEAVEQYFKQPVAAQIDYTDFSLANIIYAGFAVANKNSLREAARIMAGLMGIRDSVILNDDRSLYLGAITHSGERVTDEGDIVSWGKLDDPFVDVFFTDADGEETTPELCAEARSALLEADLIVLSAGTQWSSLIPTYASKGWKETISACKAKIVMVMNRQPDADSPGQGASEILQLLVPRYFPSGVLRVILDSDGHELMRSINEDAEALIHSTNSRPLGVSTAGAKVHSGERLASAVITTLYHEFLDSESYMFDYDDTLVGRGNAYPRSSASNRLMLAYLIKRGVNVSVCTGNSIKAVSLRCSPQYQSPLHMRVFADGGVNEYEVTLNPPSTESANKPLFIQTIAPSCVFPKTGPWSAVNITTALSTHGIPPMKIENRGGVMLSIKPIIEEYRPAVLSLVEFVLHGSGLTAAATGRTTIDIYNKGLSKQHAVRHVLSQIKGSITYVGDEFKPGGNDNPVRHMYNARVACLPITGPTETAIFLKALQIKNTPNSFLISSAL